LDFSLFASLRQTFLVLSECKSDVIISYSPLFSFLIQVILDSWYSPAIRISRNINLIIIHDFMFDVIITIVTGNSRAVSISKLRKITAIRKNRSENGNCADLFWVISTLEW
jgi:hypothetical protein